MIDINFKIKKQIEESRKNLLDMGMRNNLLNFRELKRTIPIIDENPAELYQILVFEENFMEFIPNPEKEKDKKENSHDSKENPQAMTDSKMEGSEQDIGRNKILWTMPSSDEDIPDKHKDIYLQTDLSEKDLQKRLFTLNQFYKTSLEEQGYNSLYLALGFLKWKETDGNGSFRKAPLILIPVKIHRESVAKPFIIKWDHDDIQFNLSLQFKLREYGVELPDFEEFDIKKDVYSYFNKVKNSISKKKDWEIDNNIFLSNFNFRKFVMYKDLDLDEWSCDIEDNSIKELFYPKEYESDTFDENDVDRILHPTDVYHVVDADSSQIAVIEEAKKGKNLVVEGPPGTGKSQTIVNLIAELIANDKTVLFVSEKMAALEVVKNRLDSIGLGEWCLELHSNKSNKKDVLTNIEKTLNSEIYSVKDDTDFHDLETVRNKLNLYMNTLHKKYGNTSLDIYNLVGTCEYNRQKIEKFNQELHRFKMNDVKNLNLQKRGEIINNLEIIADAYNTVQPIQNHPWRYTSPEKLMPEDIETIESNLISLVNQINDFVLNLKYIMNITGSEDLNNLDNLEDYLDNCGVLKSDPRLIGGNDLEKLITLIEEFQEKTKDIDLGSVETNLSYLVDEIEDLLQNIKSLRAITGSEDLNNLDNLEIYSNNCEILKSNPKLINGNDLEKLITTIEEYQEKTENIDTHLFSKDLEQTKKKVKNIKNNINSLNIDKEILKSEKLEEIIIEMKEYINKIKDSEINNILEDEDLQKKLTLFKSKRNSFLKIFNGEFRNIRDEFRSYYSNAKISEEEIENDLDIIIKWNNNLKNLRETILDYSEKNITDGKIIIESEKLISWASQLETISNDLNDFTLDINNEDEKIETLEDKLNNFIEIKNLLNYIIDMDEIGKYFFSDFWDGTDSNISELKDRYNIILKFDELYASNFFSKKTIDSLNEGIGNYELENYLALIKENKSEILKKYEIVNISLNFKIDKKLKEFSIMDLNELKNELSFLLESDVDLSDSVFNSGKKGSKSLKDGLSNFIEIKNLLKNITDSDEMGKYFFSGIWKSYETDINELKNKYKLILKFNKLYESEFFSEKTIEILNSEFDKKELEKYLTLIKDNKSKILENYETINNLLSFKNKELRKEQILKTRLNLLNIEFSFLLNNIGVLHEWRVYKSNCEEYKNDYTEGIISLLDEDKLTKETIIPTFNYNFANNALKNILRTDKMLNNFSSSMYDKNVDKFKKLDKKIISLNKYRVQEILWKKRPNISGAINPLSELGLLLKEMNKKRKIKPIRKILNECSKVIRDIKPCFMMSPLSIAQFLHPKIYESHFDYVIFDEASQVKSEDALGAMLRGKNYIIMGDTKQLPPTIFFEGSSIENDSEDEYTSIKDVESILHYCSSVFSSKMLKWHYRSRHESLITVSNEEFYNNELFIYPSPIRQSEDLGLKLIHSPDSVYDRGKSSTNIKEAQNVVSYAIDHFKKHGNSKSLGIGTFSVAQKYAILEELELKLKENSEIQKYFNESGSEGFFVKNLENIQGDERDVILISIGYGFDIDKKLVHNFGPLNRDGGERRLNVLITRAREKCVVFSNFSSKDINLEKSSSKGIHALKNFLFYAETGNFPSNYKSHQDYDLEFEKSVYDFLESEGYIVEKQVGCAGFRIDLAIVDKENTDNYIIGIECDGAHYHSSSVARDRDRLRQEVLEGLGWTFHRIWSIEWYNNRSDAKKKLIEVIELANKHKNDIKKDGKNLKIDFEIENENKILEKNESNTNQEDRIRSYVYYEHEYELDDFYEKPLYMHINLISDIIELESPIHKNEVYDRIKQIYNIRATKKLKQHVDVVLENMEDTKIIFIKKNFCYIDGNYEITLRKRENPNIDLISDDEIKESVLYTLEEQYSLDSSSLAKSSSQLLGFNVFREKIKERYFDVIAEMVSKREIKFVESSNRLELNVDLKQDINTDSYGDIRQNIDIKSCIDEKKHFLKNDKLKNSVNEQYEEKKRHETDLAKYQNYEYDIYILKEKYESKEETTKDLIKMYFSSSQFTYDRFMSEITNSNNFFKEECETILRIIDIKPELSKKVENELSVSFDKLKVLVEKMDDLILELTLNAGKKFNDKEIDEMFDGMQSLIDSVKDYEYDA